MTARKITTMNTFNPDPIFTSAEYAEISTKYPLQRFKVSAFNTRKNARETHETNAHGSEAALREIQALLADVEAIHSFGDSYSDWQVEAGEVVKLAKITGLVEIDE